MSPAMPSPETDAIIIEKSFKYSEITDFLRYMAVKFKTLKYILLIFALTILWIPMRESKANEYGFFCGQRRGIPTTFYTTGGRLRAVIFWVRTDNVNKTPMERCHEVSTRLQAAHENGVLIRQNITVGRMNNQNVICLRESTDRACNYLLFTLRQNDEPRKVLLAFLNSIALLNGKPLEQVEDSNWSLNFYEYIERIPYEVKIL